MSEDDDFSTRMKRRRGELPEKAPVVFTRGTLTTDVGMYMPPRLDRLFMDVVSYYPPSSSQSIAIHEIADLIPRLGWRDPSAVFWELNQIGISWTRRGLSLTIYVNESGELSTLTGDGSMGDIAKAYTLTELIVCFPIHLADLIFDEE